MGGWSVIDLSPALWLAVLAFLAHRGARLAEIRLPPALWVLAGGLVAVLLGPALVFGRVLAPVHSLAAFPPFQHVGATAGGSNPVHGDLLLQIVPWHAAVRRFLAAGEWPLWSPWSGAGVPLLANPQAQVLQPLAVLALPLSLPRSLAVEAALRVLVAVAATFVLLRHQGAGRSASLFGAAAYGSSAFLVLYLGWPLASSAALLPLAVYATVRFLDGGGRGSWAMLVLALAAVLVVGHPDTVLWVLIVTSLFALSRTVPALSTGSGRRLGAWLAAGLVAAALTAPALAPAAFQLPRSQRAARTADRAERLETTFARSGSWGGGELREALAASARRSLPVVAPNSFGNHRFGPFWGEQRNVSSASGGFAGTAALLGALLAAASLLGRGAPRIAGERLAAGLVLVSALLAAKLPGVPLLLAQVPGLERSVAFDRRAHMVLAFGLAYLGAAAFERWRRGELRPGRVVAVTLGLGGLVAWSYLAHPFPGDPSVLRTLRMGSLALQLAVLALAAGLFASRRLGRARWAAVVLVAAQAAELLVFHAPAYPTAPADLFYPRTPALDYLAEHADGARVVGLGPALRPNVATVYGLADVRTNDPAKPWDVQRLLDPVLARGGGARFGIADTVARTDHPVLDLLGVRYVLTGPRGAAPGLERAYAGPDAAVWTRPGPLEPLFLPTSAEVWRGPPGGWWRWTAANPDFADRSLVAPSPAHGEPWSAERPTGAALEVERREPTQWSARALLPEERLLASGLYQDDGWRVLVDGERVPAVATNGPLVGAWLPAGEHRLDLVYRPPGFVAGCLLAAVALAVLGAVAISPPAARRASSSPAEGLRTC